ncbi:hypothetical protein ATETN484_0009059200 [Aspergillus terreus]|uniref:FAD-linked oxidoreductase pgmH n=1 Tax=Aspergillus terreus TaxID=33178 RepID=PGMH_ASPTE|nr:RecName: Full=FAD-linked oxidoreductase pgmH; AltName: Full=Pigmented naphthoquinones biosynthesis cluster protein H [Aspergillus terreus]GES63905.1 hypothetical protein ATETN484_0009059200 [Aspergillus terreus]
MDPNILWQARNDGSALQEEDIQQLRSSIRGTVVLKNEASEEEYNAAVTRWNNVSIRLATLVVYVEDEQDIVKCVEFVNKHYLDVAVCSHGRHSYHGASSSTGMVIDLGRMRRVSVDKEAMTVTAQGGCIARDVELPLEAEGLATVFGAVNETGIGGLTLGGGVGFLTGAHGLAADNLVSARMVLANGQVVTASDDENSDLFWAIRGAGPNFGIVTEFKYRVHKQGPVFWQMLFYSPDKLKDCVSIVNQMHNISLAQKGGDFQVMMAYLTPPGYPDLHPGLRIFYNGPEEKAKELAAPAYALGPLSVSGGMCNFSDTTRIPPYLEFEGFDRYAASSAHLDYPLDENLLLEVFTMFRNVIHKYGHHLLHPSKCILDLRNYEKVASVPIDATAYSGRFDVAWMIPDLQWDDPAMDSTMRMEVTSITAHIRERVREAKGGHVNGPRDATAIYPNISAGGEEKAKSVFGPNLPRLQVLKRKYDPDFIWNKWFPIVPA